MSIKHMSLLVISAWLLGGCTLKTAPDSSPAPAASVSPPPSGAESVSPPPSVEQKKISLTEIAQHATAADCWLAIEGGVYDVTPYIAGGKHPGGEAILQGCGKDATVLFNTRPMGSGTPHSAKAREYLQKFQIGELVTDQPAN